MNDCGEVLVLTTVSWLDEVVVCADRNLVTPPRFDVRIADSVPLSSTSSFFSLKDSPRSLIVSPPTVPVSAASSPLVMSRMVPSPNSTALDDAVPSEFMACWAITASR